MPKHSIPMDPKVREAIKQINSYLKSSGKTRWEAASATNVSQPQVSKILNGQVKKESDNLKALCQYAGIEYPPIFSDPLNHPKIKAAITRVWDGRDETLELIVRLLECAAHVKGL